MMVGDCCESDKRSSSHHICAKAQDVWTLGCLAYWALTGKKAFCAGTLAPPACLHAIREQHQIWVRPPDMPDMPTHRQHSRHHSHMLLLLARLYGVA